MPLDGKVSDYTTKPDVFSLEGLIAWLETQPGETAYEFSNNEGDCLIGRYGRAHGEGRFWRSVHTAFFEKNWLRVASHDPYTYSAALTRARALLAQEGQGNE